MFSAIDFLPSSMTEFMNLVRTMSPNFGSGRTSRFSGRRRRAIGLFLSLQPDPEHVGSHQSTALMGALSGAYSRCGLFRALGAVFRAGLPAVLDTLRVEHAVEHVIADAGEIADAAAADQHNAMLLEVVALARDVADHFALVGQTDLGHLAQRRVRLLRGGRIDTGTDAALLRVLLHRRDLRLGLLRFATLADQLVNRRHEALHLSLPEIPAVTLPKSKSAKSRRPFRPPGLHVQLSNVQLLPAPSESQETRTAGHIARGR